MLLLKKIKCIDLFVSQGTERQEVCLWREAAVQNVQVGESITVTHLKARNNQLHSTAYTAFMVLPYFYLFVQIISFRQRKSVQFVILFRKMRILILCHMFILSLNRSRRSLKRW